MPSLKKGLLRSTAGDQGFYIIGLDDELHARRGLRRGQIIPMRGEPHDRVGNAGEP